MDDTGTRVTAPRQGVRGTIDRRRTRVIEALEEFGRWRTRLVEELKVLPDTLADLRTGAANFERVGQRLADASESLEDVTRLYESTLADATRRTAGTADALRTQLESMATTSPEKVQASVAELQRTLETMAQLNPFWPRSPRRDTQE